MTEFPAGFFDRADVAPDSEFYGFDRLVTHLDDEAIEVVGALYDELELTGDVLDLCSSWVSHFATTPARLVALGMNANELATNRAATDTLVHDLNVTPVMPFDGESFDAVTCCVSVDYLIRPIEVFAEVARLLRPDGVFVVTFSNRCFPSKVVRGWLAASDHGRCEIVESYFAAVDAFTPAVSQRRNSGAPGDPLFAVWARKHAAWGPIRAAASEDQSFITDMQYEAFFVPPGNAPFARSIVDEPDILKYHASFGLRPGDVGRVAVGPDGSPRGAAWVRLIEGYGFVDEMTPELGIAVHPAWRGQGVGSELLRSLVATVPRMSLSVDRRNPAMRLYERFGFEVVRTDGDHSVVMLRDAARS